MVSSSDFQKRILRFFRDYCAWDPADGAKAPLYTAVGSTKLQNRGSAFLAFGVSLTRYGVLPKPRSARTEHSLAKTSFPESCQLLDRILPCRFGLLVRLRPWYSRAEQPPKQIPLRSGDRATGTGRRPIPKTQSHGDRSKRRSLCHRQNGASPSL